MSLVNISVTHGYDEDVYPDDFFLVPHDMSVMRQGNKSTITVRTQFLDALSIIFAILWNKDQSWVYTGSSLPTIKLKQPAAALPVQKSDLRSEFDCDCF